MKVQTTPPKPNPLNLSKMQQIRKRELKRAMDRLHETIRAYKGTPEGAKVYGLRVAITVLADMRNEINQERGTPQEKP